MKIPLQRFRTNLGARIYRIPLDLFPELTGFAHLILAGDLCVLLDVGSGFGECNAQLDNGIDDIRNSYGEAVTWSTITHVVISHGHIDHFGGLSFVRRQCDAPVIVHGLDRRVLTHYDELLSMVARRLRAYLQEAGLSPDRLERVMAMYMLNKGLFESQPVDRTCEQIGMHLGRLEWIHVPGHCPGQIVTRIDDVLLSADHVLETTSPHQAPERLSLMTGLSHYLDSLAAIRSLSRRLRVVLGGHEGPVYDLDRRVREIADVHHNRLNVILESTAEPQTACQIADALFPGVDGYHSLLAIEEAGAHIEYLHQRGLLSVENLSEIDRFGAVPILYKRTPFEDLELLNTCFCAFAPATAAAVDAGQVPQMRH